MPRDPGPTDPWGVFLGQTRDMLKSMPDGWWVECSFEAFGCGDEDCDEDHDHDIHISRGNDRLEMTCSGNPASGEHNVIPRSKWGLLKELGWGIEDSRRLVIIWRVDDEEDLDDDEVDIDEYLVTWPLSEEDLDDAAATFVTTLRQVFGVPLPSSLYFRQKRKGLFSRLLGD